MKTISEIINDYIFVIDAIYGTTFDSTYGFSLQLQEIVTDQQITTSALADPLEKQAAIYELDKKTLTYAHTDRHFPAHATSIGNYKIRNCSAGPNYRWITNMATVSIYEYWEGTFRGKIAKELDIEERKLLIDEFGDLRLLRNAILHKLGRGTKDLEKAKIFNWFKYNQLINIDMEKFDFMITKIKERLGEIKTHGAAQYQS